MVFTFGQVWIGIRQSKIAREQTRIADKTRGIAVAALNRPYVFFEMVAHNFGEWRGGRDRLRFAFRLTNHGTSPAVIRAVNASAVLSYGPNSGPTTDNQEFLRRAGIRAFPSEREVCGGAGWSGSGLEPGQPSEPAFGEHMRRLTTLKAGERSDEFVTTLSVPPLEFPTAGPPDAFVSWLYDKTDWEGSLAPWLTGEVAYQSVFGTEHRTGFCVRAVLDGHSHHYDKRPYTEQT